MMSASRFIARTGAWPSVPYQADSSRNCQREYLAISDQSDTFSDLGGTEWDDKRMEDADQSQVHHRLPLLARKGRGKAGPSSSTPSRGQTAALRADRAAPRAWASRALAAARRQLPALRARRGRTCTRLAAACGTAQFGVGEVTQELAGCELALVTVKFQGVGVKTLVVEYARLTRIE